MCIRDRYTESFVDEKLLIDPPLAIISLTVKSVTDSLLVKVNIKVESFVEETSAISSVPFEAVISIFGLVAS